jgi:hypothetical protein
MVNQQPVMVGSAVNHPPIRWHPLARGRIYWQAGTLALLTLGCSRRLPCPGRLAYRGDETSPAT